MLVSYILTSKTIKQTILNFNSTPTETLLCCLGLDDTPLKTDYTDAIEYGRDAMFNAPTRTVFDEITDFLASSPSPEEILAYKFSDDLQARIADLTARNTEDELTPDEKVELFDIIHADDIISMVKIKTRLRLKGIKP
jgi:hypothetical protein